MKAIKNYLEELSEQISKGQEFNPRIINTKDIAEIEQETINLINQLLVNVKEDHDRQTETMQQEEKERAIRAEAVLDTMLDALIVISDTGIIQSANRATERIFGYDISELAGKNIKIVMPEPFHSEHDLYLRHYLETGNKKVIGAGREVSARRKDGSVFPAHLSVGEVHLENQRLFTGIIRDLSEQKKAEEELRKYTRELEEINWVKTRLSSIAELAATCDDLADLSSSILSCLANEFEIGYGSFYIRETDEKGKLRDSFWLTGTYALTDRKNLNGSIKIGEGLLGQSAHEKKPILLSNVPSDYISIRSSLGESPPKNIISQPIIEGNQVIALLELASFNAFDQKFLTLLSQISEILAMEISRTLAKQRTEQLLLESQELAGRLKLQQAELEQSNSELTQKTEILEQSEIALKEQQIELERSNAELEEKSIRLEEERKKTEKAAAEIREAKKDLEKKAEELEEISKYKSEFLANMSHELRTPLNSLLLLSGQLKDNSEGNLTEQQVSMVECIHSGGHDLLYLINDILDLSKVEAGMLDVNFEEVELESFINQIAKKIEPQISQKRLSLNIKFIDKIKCINTDPFRLEQVIKNLLSNAIKFTDNGSISIIIEKNRSNSHLDIKIQDTGIGIPKNKLDLIFDAFKQVDGSTSRKHGGTGLGLSISKQLITILGGEISVESTLGQGSIFILSMPLQQQSNFTPQRPSFSIKAETFKDAKPNNILVISENKLISQELESFLEGQGYQSETFDKIDDAINYAKNNKVFGIIVDDNFESELSSYKRQLASHNIPVHILRFNSNDDSKLFDTNIVVDFAKAFSLIKTEDSAPLKRVLVAEDDPFSRKQIKEVLSPEYIKTVEVSSGTEVIKELSNQEFDCFILDFQLPDINAIDLLKKIHTSSGFKIPPVIINTCRELTKDEIRTLNHYTDQIIIKGPFSSERLAKEVSSFLDKSPAEKSQQESIVDTIDDALLKNQHILIADDDLRNTLALSTVLKKYGLKTSIADNGEMVLDKLSKNKDLKLIIMDVMMPIKDGFDTIKELRSTPEYKNIPIIALSASTMPEVKSRCLEVGANDFMSKPVDLDNLVPILKLWLSDDK